MIKVLHIITRLIIGGAQENTLDTCLGLNKNKYEVYLIAGPTNIYKNQGSLENKASLLGKNFIKINTLVREISPIHDLGALLDIYKILKMIKPHIVHTHTSKAGILGRAAAYKSRVPIIIHTPHGHIFHSYYGLFKTKFFLYLEKLAAAYTDKIITLTEIEKQEHIKYGIANEDKFITIHSGVDIDKFHKNVNKDKAREKLGLSKGDFVILTIGRLAKVKGQRYLIEALYYVKKEFNNIKLLLVGDGEERNNLKELTNRLNLNNNVEFLGIREDIENILPYADLCVVPSLNEGMGRVVIEAYASGVPVIGSNVGGIKELIKNNETGLLFEVGNIKELSEKIIYMINNKDKALKFIQAAKDKILKKYTKDEMIKKIEILYKDELKRKDLNSN